MEFQAFKMDDKTTKISCRTRPNMAKMTPQIDPKSMKNRGCVADASLERLKGSLEVPGASSGAFKLAPFFFENATGTEKHPGPPKFDQKSVKCCSFGVIYRPKFRSRCDLSHSTLRI